MPIRPSELKRYPPDWRVISRRIKERSGGRCECEGECALHRTTPGPRRCEERHGEPAQWAKGTVILTVAHLNHTPEDCRDENLKAMCQRCHLRYDHEHHQRNAAATRRAKKQNGELFALTDARQSMNWTALDPTGRLARISGRSVEFHDGRNADLPVDPYTPVYAADEIGGVLVYRETHPTDNARNSVRYATTAGQQGVLSEQCEGKWPLAIRRLAPGRFEVAWINRGVQVSSVTMAEVLLEPFEVRALGERTITPAMILMELDQLSGTLRVDATDDGYDRRSFTAGGQTRSLIHWQEVEGRAVGIDGAPDAPNRLLLADTDGWYVVSDYSETVLFPARLDLRGNVAAYPGLYFTNAAIRTRPLASAPDKPRPVEIPVVTGYQLVIPSKLSPAWYWHNNDGVAALAPGNAAWSEAPAHLSDRRPVYECQSGWPIAADRELIAGAWSTEAAAGGVPGLLREIAAVKAKMRAPVVYLHTDSEAHHELTLEAIAVCEREGVVAVPGIHVTGAGCPDWLAEKFRHRCGRYGLGIAWHFGWLGTRYAFTGDELSRAHQAALDLHARLPAAAVSCFGWTRPGGPSHCPELAAAARQLAEALDVPLLRLGEQPGATPDPELDAAAARVEKKAQALKDRTA
jgi:hypothetical protein